MSAQSVLLTGGTGFIGGHVIRALQQRDASVWVWSRDPARARARVPHGVQVVAQLDDIPANAAIDAIVNLAGAPVIGLPWTRSRRRVLIESRVRSTEAVLAWCAARAPRPRVIVSASAIGFYGTAGDDWLDESSPPQPAFQSQLCEAREAATQPATALGMRVVNLRLGLVLGADGGILKPLTLAARLGGAAVIGDGRQWMSWIHVADVVRIVERALDDAQWRGAVNAVGPNPVRQREFQRELARTLHRPLWLRVPGFALRVPLGEMAELLVKGQRVMPRRLVDAGFEFRHPTLDGALADLLA